MTDAIAVVLCIPLALAVCALVTAVGRLIGGRR